MRGPPTGSESLFEWPCSAISSICGEGPAAVTPGTQARKQRASTGRPTFLISISSGPGMHTPEAA